MASPATGPAHPSEKSAAAASASAGAAAAPIGADARYTFDGAKLDDLRSRSPWTDDPKYFKKAAVSPSAIMKMMMHCHSGVEKGLKKGGNPIEVMGLLLGRPDPVTPRTLVVTDVFPLPIEGFETRVIADDEDVVNHMIALGESMERTRKEKFMGWYHSHPFDVGINTHCFLSQTDLSTQLQWQRAEDPHGNPFLAVVIDPLRSAAKNEPILKAFRAYPPEYNSPVANECPDGSVVHDEQARLEKWGSCWNRYYEVGLEYFMSASARRVMGILTQNFLWMRTLGTTPMLEAELRQRFPERVGGAAEKIRGLDIVSAAGEVGGVETAPGGGRSVQQRGMGFGGGAGVASGMGSPPQPAPAAGAGSSTVGGGGEGTSSSFRGSDDGGEMAKATRGVVELATEKLHGNIGQVAKKELFS